MPETCENCLGLVNDSIHYANHTCEIYQVLPYSVDFKAPEELWNPLSKTALSKCSFIWNKGPIVIWNDHKAQKWLVFGTYKYFLKFWHCKWVSACLEASKMSNKATCPILYLIHLHVICLLLSILMHFYTLVIFSIICVMQWLFLQQLISAIFYKMSAILKIQFSIMLHG